MPAFGRALAERLDKRRASCTLSRRGLKRLARLLTQLGDFGEQLRDELAADTYVISERACWLKGAGFTSKTNVNAVSGAVNWTLANERRRLANQTRQWNAGGGGGGNGDFDEFLDDDSSASEFDHGDEGDEEDDGGQDDL